MMNYSRLVFVSVLLMIMVTLLAYNPVQADGVEVNNEAVSSHTYHGSFIAKKDCGGACKARCRLSSRPNLCKRACGTCCQRCSCVPPGTAGNYEVCPCYATLTTHGGQRKCP